MERQKAHLNVFKQVLTLKNGGIDIHQLQYIFILVFDEWPLEVVGIFLAPKSHCIVLAAYNNEVLPSLY